MNKYEKYITKRNKPFSSVQTKVGRPEAFDWMPPNLILHPPTPSLPTREDEEEFAELEYDHYQQLEEDEISD